jgi:hypothetical protein
MPRFLKTNYLYLQNSLQNVVPLLNSRNIENENVFLMPPFLGGISAEVCEIRPQINPHIMPPFLGGISAEVCEIRTQINPHNSDFL